MRQRYVGQTVIATAIVVGPLWVGRVVQAVPATRPADLPPGVGGTTQPSSSVEAARDKLAADVTAWDEAFTSRLMTDAKARAAATGKVLPLLRQVEADLDVVAETDPGQKRSVASQRLKYTACLALFGDADAVRQLQAATADPDPARALDARCRQMVFQWRQSARDPATQVKVFDRVEALAKANPQNDVVAQAVIDMIGDETAASPELSDRVTGVLMTVMKSPVAVAAQAMAGDDDELADKLVDKPMVVKGRTVDGKDFSTADWKGKVILVDFWATWCGPCKADLPRVEKLYTDHHAQGLEIVGVSNDLSMTQLSEFVKRDGHMPWPQLFDAKAADEGKGHPVTTGYGIKEVPTMFLIDRKGVCRSVAADDDMDDLLPKLLAEK